MKKRDTRVYEKLWRTQSGRNEKPDRLEDVWKISERVWRRLGGMEIAHSTRSSHRNEAIAVKRKTRRVRAMSKIERDGVWPGV